MRRLFILLALAALATPVACSLINAPDDVRPGGAGGAAASSSSSSSSSKASSSSGSSSSSGGMTCSMAADCVKLNDVCGVGVCINGMCQKQADPSKEGMPCDDGLFCTDMDRCQSGTCAGTPIVCPVQKDPCQVSTCTEADKMCTVKPGNDGAMCDDSDPCSTGESCFNGACKGGQPTDCSMLNNSCTLGVCTPGVGCQASNINEGLPCDVANICANSQCVTGKCTATSIFNGKPCDDGLFCTDNDMCQNAVCAGVPKVCPGATSCVTVSCDEATDKCVPSNNPNGTVCDDGDPCTFGTTCQTGTCTPAGNVNMCVNGDQCCPAGCNFNNDNDCLWWASGPQQNVPEAMLTGWTQCYSDNYANSATAVSTILSQCNKGKLLMGCRPVGAPNFTLLAMAPRADVLFDCGMLSNCTKQSNGVGWYFNDSWSWGFAGPADAVTRNSCDTTATNPDFRLCWHTGGMNIQSGYRCGNNFLNGVATWERRVYHAN